MFTYTNTCALGDIPYHYYFKLQVETINYMNSMENTVNKPKLTKIRIEVISWKCTRGVKLRLNLIKQCDVFKYKQAFFGNLN